MFTTKRPVDPSLRLLLAAPISHVFASAFAVVFWWCGGTVVLPSATFSPLAVLATLDEEKCIHMPAVPVMIQALLAHPAFSIEKTRSLHSVYLSSTLVQLSLVELCKTRLDAKYAIPTFGMTEGVDAFLWLAGIEPKVHESHCGLGTVAPGAKIRVCPPGSRSPVRRGALGELHVNNPRMIKGYINVKSESFYTGEDGKTAWFVTGDQAMMDDEGVVYIMGR